MNRRPAGRQRIEQTYPGTSLRLRLRYVPGYEIIGVLAGHHVDNQGVMHLHACVCS
ncbi:MAG: hypothetical protein HDS65_07550 [Bacteroidales bacterium]|nr:hypothetical protein [Bacteroidales bacterium]